MTFGGIHMCESGSAKKDLSEELKVSPDRLRIMEIFVDLHSSGIYLSGETLKASVTFTNVHTFDPEQIMEEKLEHLAWASVQIQCQCQIAQPQSRRESESAMDSLTSVTSTSLQPQKDAFCRDIFATSPIILFCDLTLEPGESKSFDFQDVIPASGPHSYHGRGLKYAYRVIVASQRLNQPICSLRIPFRVLSVSNLKIDLESIQHQQVNFSLSTVLPLPCA